MPFTLRTLAAALLAAPPAHATEFACGGSYMPIEKNRQISVEQALVMLFIPIGGLYQDSLEKLPAGPLRFHVIDAAGKDVAGARVGAVHNDSGRFLGLTQGNGSALTLPFGAYEVNAVIPGNPLRWGTAHVDHAKGKAAADIRIDQSSPYGAPGKVPDKVVGGSGIAVGWTGPRPPGARISVLDPREKGSFQVVESEDVGGGEGDFSVRAPFKPGTYDLVLALCAPDVPLARWKIAVTKPVFTLTAPDKAAAGGEIAVTVGGPVADGDLAVETPSGDMLSGVRSGEKVTDGQYRIRAPLKAGTYRLAFNIGGETFATRPLQVTAATVGMTAPASIRIGALVPVTVSGASPEDVQVDVWTLGPQAKRLADGLDLDQVRIPGKPGAYEIRLVTRDFSNPKLLARAPVQVIDGPVFAAVPAEVAAGERFTVTLVEPKTFGEEINIIDRGSKDIGWSKVFFPRGDKLDLSFQAPDKPGDYDLVYVVPKSGSVVGMEIARRPLKVK